jgi:hypothetical protein
VKGLPKPLALPTAVWINPPAKPLLTHSETPKAQKNAQKTRRVPTVSCTLCWAVWLRQTHCLKKIPLPLRQIFTHNSIFANLLHIFAKALANYLPPSRPKILR